MPHVNSFDEVAILRAENARLRDALSELLVDYVAARKEGNISTFPATAQAIIRRAEKALYPAGQR